MLDAFAIQCLDSVCRAARKEVEGVSAVSGVRWVWRCHHGAVRVVRKVRSYK